MLTLEIDGSKRVFDILDKVEKQILDLNTPLEEIGTVMIDEFEQNFTEEGKRLQEPWQKLKDSTIKERIRLGYGAGPILVRTGQLMKGFRKEVGKYFVRVYNPVKYFQYHQTGTAHLPKRRMILAPERLKQEIVAVITKYIHNLI